MVITITHEDFCIALGVWYAIGLVTLLVSEFLIFRSPSRAWEQFLRKPFSNICDYLVLSVFGPLLILYVLIVKLFFDSLLNWKK